MITIRRLDAERDVDAYRICRLQMLKDDPKAFTSTFEHEVAQTMECLADRLCKQHILAAFLGEKIVGMAALVFLDGSRRHCAEVVSVYTSPNHRKMRIASQIMERLFSVAKENGIGILDLRVLASQEAAIRLYESLGFEEWGRLKRAVCIDGVYYDGVAMSKCLG